MNIKQYQDYIVGCYLNIPKNKFALPFPLTSLTDCPFGKDNRWHCGTIHLPKSTITTNSYSTIRIKQRHSDSVFIVSIRLVLKKDQIFKSNLKCNYSFEKRPQCEQSSCSLLLHVLHENDKPEGFHPNTLHMRLNTSTSLLSYINILQKI